MRDVELIGNALCLDFANTVNARPVADRDWLRTSAEAVTWAVAVGRPIEDETGLDATLPAARELREAVFRVFQPLAHGRRPPRPDLDTVAATYADGVAHGRLEGAGGVAHGRQDAAEGFVHGRLEEAGGGFRFAWTVPRTARSLLWEVAAAAVELLTYGPLDRLGECPTCCWLFLDTSKNRRRRWCSMATCGSRDKSRRYYAGHSS